MAALLFLLLLDEHSWFAFSNLKENHPLSFLRRNDGGQNFFRLPVLRQAPPVPSPRARCPAGEAGSQPGVRATVALHGNLWKFVDCPGLNYAPPRTGFSVVSNDEFCPVLNTTNSLVWLRKVCGCAYYTAMRRQKWAARVWQIASDHLCILFVIPSDLLNSPAARRRVKEQILRAYEGGITTHGND